ncbi:DNA helicase IV [Enterovibrio paralichthyis]|uniref:DNA helicase IV n=1 Tax=Enterovibrio paralichthyis TaxID=2853805 RepID=UPI001C4887AD|nr:DNA helicase IV [Enterovibrio paralichthyis]MBV7299270.1 DNA helicase IV [Enterovibrio paralichthyis]
MKLVANRIAQWFVQGAHYSVMLDEHCLVFESKSMKETVPFSIWDGQCRLSRGLLWGRLTFVVSPLDAPARSITIYGLPWRGLKAFTESLTEAYQAWLGKQQGRFKMLEPDFFALRDELAEHNGFLRHDDLVKWQQKVDALFAKNQIHPQVMSSANPALYNAIFGWMQNSEATRSARNAAWRESELERWKVWFDGIESSPLNLSQREAVLMDDNHNLLLAGAGSGKTSVLMARAQYLVASGQTLPERILMLAFGKKASEEMSERLQKAGLKNVDVSTFHALALKVIKTLTGQHPTISPLATDEESKTSWITLWLAENLAQQTVEKRWLKHLGEWSIPGLNADSPLSGQAHSAKLHKWLWRQLDILLQQPQSASALKAMVKGDAQAESEYALISPIVRSYQNTLKEEKAYDFHGLIREATKLLSKKSATFGAQFDHIMVDEYQDISPSRLTMLEALCGGQRDRAPALFAVGDDWQAIFRFAGADVSLTTDFLTRFPHGNIRYLDTTYRFHSQIGAVANPFVQVNPKQLSKPLNSVKVQKKKAVHLMPSESLEDVLATIAKGATGELQTVMVIGRNHANRPERFSKWQEAYPNLSLNFVTAHASKGLEADYVCIVDVNDGVFPSRSTAVGMEAALLRSDEETPHSEERRLFYVALTRAKKECWIFTNPEKPSPFVVELWQGGYPVTSKIPKKALVAV